MNYNSARTLQASKLNAGSRIIHAGKIWEVKKVSPVKYQIHFDRTSVNAEDTVLTLLALGEKDAKLLQVASEHRFSVPEQTTSFQWLKDVVAA